MRLALYNVNMKYCDYLRKSDPFVPFLKNKESRPFIGIVIRVFDADFYAPLTSPKRKHLQMKNQLDFIKIDNGTLGAINLNNMIPINKEQLSLIDTHTLVNDSKDIVHYKNLLNKQLLWCIANQDSIQRKAQSLYRLMIENKLPEPIRNRCCDFQKDIELLKQYTKIEIAG